MAKKAKKDEIFSYKETVNELKTSGPKRLYLIYGEEAYLSEQVFSEIKKLCLTDEHDDFSYRRLTERDFSSVTLSEAVDSVPFLSERSLVEIRGIDLNKASEPDELIRILSDIPDYCTVVFMCGTEFEPDKRLKLYKVFAKNGKEIKTTAQSGDMLIRWIVKRFAAHGKRIDMAAAQRLITVSGDLMSRLIPEIDKVAAFSKGDAVTVDDVNAVAHHIPDAVVFDMTDRMANGDYNMALALLSELLADKENEPVMINAVIGMQMRKLYVAKLASESGQGSEYLMRVCKISREFVASRLIATARKFTVTQLRRAVQLSAETDYLMKSSGAESSELLKDCVLRIAAGDCDA